MCWCGGKEPGTAFVCVFSSLEGTWAESREAEELASLEYDTNEVDTTGKWGLDEARMEGTAGPAMCRASTRGKLFYHEDDDGRDVPAHALERGEAEKVHNQV